MKHQTATTKHDFSFKKKDRLLKRAAFTAVNKNGKKFNSFCFVARAQKNQAAHSRLGLTVSKKVGPAVARNHLKRLVREYFRLNRQFLSGSWDINIIAKKAAADISSKRVFGSLEEIFKNIEKTH